ncbi:MAG: hypothetical protein LBK04_03745 [Clostridiales Family XIII bacterium]|jgi:hypothetical protein|nr:hypothetical protein [Clostridiales Family XIII bacterium]
MADDYKNNSYANPGEGTSPESGVGGDPGINADTYNGPSGGGYAEPGSSADYSGPDANSYTGPAAGAYGGPAAGGYGYSAPNSQGAGQAWGSPGGQANASSGTGQSSYSGGGGRGYQNYGGTPPPNYPPYGQNMYGAVPPEATGWNWGAFYLNWIWGIGNRCYLPLLCIIPVFGFFWMFVCGFKGNEWAWKNGEFANLEQFDASRRTWNRAGFVAFLVSIGLVVLYIILFIAFGLSMASILYGSGYYY